MNKQTPIIKRIVTICDEFDSRVHQVGVTVARVELAKSLAECEQKLEAKNLIILKLKNQGVVCH